MEEIRSQHLESSQQHSDQGMQIALPNSTTVLILGILSIPACCCYGVPGLILGIIGLVLSKTASGIYNENPNLYTSASFSNLKAGKICALIGVILSILSVIMYIVYAILLVSSPEFMEEVQKGIEMMDQ